MATKEKFISRPLCCHLEEECQATLTRGAIVSHSSASSPVAHTAHDKMRSLQCGDYGAQIYHHMTSTCLDPSRKFQQAVCGFCFYKDVKTVLVQKIQSREIFA
jgi:hypothetical protein